LDWNVEDLLNTISRPEELRYEKEFIERLAKYKRLEKVTISDTSLDLTALDLVEWFATFKDGNSPVFEILSPEVFEAAFPGMVHL
jgi:hypothetical protein